MGIACQNATYQMIPAGLFQQLECTVWAQHHQRSYPQIQTGVSGVVSGLKLDPHMPELAMATALLLVPSLCLDRLPYGFL